MFLSYARRVAAMILFGLALAGCAGPATQISTPPASQPTTAGQPTGAALPTAQPPGRPAAAPERRPTFGFEPREGTAGARINLSGWDFAPGSDIAVRLGLPQPVGEALAAARVDPTGRWDVSLVLPAQLPSGDPVPAGRITLVVMDANSNQALASAPFSYAAPIGPDRAAATQTVAELLHAVGTPAAWGYLASNLDHSLPVEQALGLRHHWVTYDVGAPLDRPSEVLFVPAVLIGDAERHQYEFTLVIEHGQWKISGASWLRSDPIGSPSPAAARPGVYDYSNIATVAEHYLRSGQPYQPLIVGAVAVANTHAVAYALPYPGVKQFVYLRQAPGAGWEVVLATDAPTADLLAGAGVPRALLDSGEVPAITDTLLAHYNSSAYGGADGWLSVEAVSEGFARATLHRGEAGDLTVFLQAVDGGWEWLVDGPALAPEVLDQLGVPEGVR